MYRLRPLVSAIFFAASSAAVSAPSFVLIDLNALKTTPNSSSAVKAGKGPLSPMLDPLGNAVSPLVDAVNTQLDPLTDTIDQELGAPIIDALDPVLVQLHPLIDPVLVPVDQVSADLFGSIVSDAARSKNRDKKKRDGDGLVNDTLSNKKHRNSGSEAGEFSPVPWLSEPVGEIIQPLVDAVDLGLDPLTDPIDDQLLEPILDAVAPLTDPVLALIEPVTDPVDGLLDDLTGGSLEDALTNIDDNRADGNGVVNDLLGGESENENSGKEAGELSPLHPVTRPVGLALAPLIDAVDNALDPLTDIVDDELLEPVLDAVAPVTEPLLAAVEPVTDPVDGVVADLTGGSVEDALTNQDDNRADGNGVVNDLLGGPRAPGSGREAGEHSALPELPALIDPLLNDVVTPLADALDHTLDPVTDIIDDQLLEPVLDAAAPLTEPLLEAVEPATDPVDGLLADITGGSLEDALTNNDDNTRDGNGVVNDLLGGSAADNTDQVETFEGDEVSPIHSITGPLGVAIAPLVDAVDEALDPITDPVDDQIIEPVLDAVAPVTDPILAALEPVTSPVDGIVADLTGGSLEDALTNIDDNTADGNGAVNDLLGGPRVAGSGTEAGEHSPVPQITGPLGEALAPVVDSVDQGLDPLTDAVDDAVVEPILDAAAPVTEPLLATVEPATDPVDGVIADLTGGSLEDALTNDDDNTADGNGLVNDLLGGDNSAADEFDSSSPLAAVTAPLGDSVAPLLDAVDTTLDPATDAVDQQAGEPVLDAAAPVVDPVLAAVDPVTSPVDAIVNDLTNGSLEDALTNSDSNVSGDGDGIVNDLLGGDNVAAGESDEHSPLPIVTEPLGEAIAELVDDIDTGLDPLTDVVDDQLVEPVLDAAAPVTEPILATVEPATDPVDGLLEDLTGGSVEDALTNDDDNTADGNGLVNDLLGGEGENTASGSEAGESSAVASVTGPLGDSIDTLVDTLDETLDPVTDGVDGAVEPVLDAASPATDPLLATVEPVTDPVDGIVEDITGGSVEDALTNDDDNTTDGNGLVNDLLGGDDPAGETSPVARVSGPVGDNIATVVDDLDDSLGPFTDVVDSEIGEAVVGIIDPVTSPLIDELDGVTDPADGLMEDLTGGSVEDAATNNDENTADGNGVVNDLLGGGTQLAFNSSGPFDQAALLALYDNRSVGFGDCQDGDSDGVCDNRDECLATPSGKAVLPNGCHLPEFAPLRLRGVNFELDSDVLTARAKQVLNAAAQVIKQSPTARFEIAGHTDALASDAYNLTLSQKRAVAVVRYLEAQGVEEGRLTAKGYGEAEPVASNNTEAGRAENRRVELRPRN